MACEVYVAKLISLHKRTLDRLRGCLIKETNVRIEHIFLTTGQLDHLTHTPRIFFIYITMHWPLNRNCRFFII